MNILEITYSSCGNIVRGVIVIKRNHYSIYFVGVYFYVYENMAL